ncbi:YbfB/YjiJ family MFS transporter, partial [Streptomyces sp. NPDC005349]|uniref:YbfB/YjiJ family MFS transporter n=1 Tax=Streptomyces sp. NPDC005349 TaxID=3157037 RepID=UPI0033B3FAA5
MPRRAGAADPAATALAQRPCTRRWFTALLASYLLEGMGYIIAGTFLVAALQEGAPGWIGSGAWIVVGLALRPQPRPRPRPRYHSCPSPSGSPARTRAASWPRASPRPAKTDRQMDHLRRRVVGRLGAALAGQDE